MTMKHNGFRGSSHGMDRSNLISLTYIMIMTVILTKFIRWFDAERARVPTWDDNSGGAVEQARSTTIFHAYGRGRRRCEQTYTHTQARDTLGA